jgi:hypothetical protein
MAESKTGKGEREGEAQGRSVNEQCGKHQCSGALSAIGSRRQVLKSDCIASRVYTRHLVGVRTVFVFTPAFRFQNEGNRKQARDYYCILDIPSRKLFGVDLEPKITSHAFKGSDSLKL